MTTEIFTCPFCGATIEIAALCRSALCSNCEKPLTEDGHFFGPLFAQAVKLCPSSPSAWLGLGWAAYNREKYKAALAMFEKSLFFDPKHARAWLNKGNALAKLERHEEAIAACDAAMSLDPADTEAHFNKGNVLGVLGRYDEAIASYDMAIRIDPANANAHFNKGFCLATLGRHTEAIVAYDSVICLAPENANVHLNKGNSLKNLGRQEEAIAAYDASIFWNSEAVAPYHNKGLCLFDAGRHQEAIAAFDVAISLDPENVAAYNNKGYNLFVLHRYEEAIASFDAAISLDPANTGAYKNKGLCLSHLGHDEEAIAVYDIAISLDPEYAAAYSDKGCSLLDLGRYEEALAAFDAAISLDPEDASTLYNKGTCLAALGHDEEAIAAYDLVIGLDRADAAVYFNKGNSLVELGRHEEAIVAYDAALCQDPKHPRICMGKGRALAKLGNNEEAFAHINRAMELCRIFKNKDDLGSVLSERGKMLQAMAGASNVKKAIANYHASFVFYKFFSKTTYQSTANTVTSLQLEAITCLQLRSDARYVKKAVKAVGLGMQELRAPELAGKYNFRKLREYFFNTAMDVYSICAPERIADVILEQLDPQNAGSAPQSSRMHMAALDALWASKVSIFEKGSADVATIMKIEATIKRLHEIRSEYFAGTASGAFLQASFCELTGDVKKAEKIITDYMLKRPSDPEGYQLLGAHYARRKECENSKKAFLKAVEITAKNIPANADEIILHQVLSRLQRIIALAIDQAFGEWPLQFSDNDQEVVQKKCSSINRWIGQIESHFNDKLKGVAGQMLDLIQQENDRRQQEWQRCRENELLEQFSHQMQIESKQRLNLMLDSLNQDLVLNQRQFFEACIAVYRDICDSMASEWQKSDAKKRILLESRAADRLIQSLKNRAQELPGCELVAAEKKLKEELGTLWDVLSSEEQHHLCIAQLYRTDKHAQRFLGLSLGLAVEASLSDRLFVPLREEVYAGHAEKIVCDDTCDAFDMGLVRYINGDHGCLELGKMVGYFSKVVFGSDDKGSVGRFLTRLTCSLFGGEKARQKLCDTLGPGARRLMQRVTELPNAASLAIVDKDKCRVRKKALERINLLRIKCAHPLQPLSNDELEWLWQYVVSDKTDAFMQYWGSAVSNNIN